jgi:hypothetical protein
MAPSSRDQRPAPEPAGEPKLPAMTFLFGEVPTAPLLMTAALVVAFLGSVGIGVYVVRHTPDRFTSPYDVEKAEPSKTSRAA